MKKYEYNGNVCRIEEDFEDDNIKKFHFCDNNGKSEMIGWTPYEEMEECDFVLWVDLGKPERDTNAVGPLHTSDLIQKLAKKLKDDEEYVVKGDCFKWMSEHTFSEVLKFEEVSVCDDCLKFITKGDYCVSCRGTGSISAYNGDELGLVYYPKYNKFKKIVLNEDL